ncbi:hypothetical protein QTH09_17380 [Clostridium perfringens]|nr:hypothetical protein [Clostridium perfringens]
MKNYLFTELESVNLELSRLSLINLNNGGIEYKKYLISKVERLSKEIMDNGRKTDILKLQGILRNFLFDYDIKEYYKYFGVAI